MNTINLITMAAFVGLFFFNLFMFLFGKELFKGKVSFKGWRTQVIIFSLGSVLFFIYFVSTINSAGAAQTITDGTSTFRITDNSYMDAFNYLYLLIAMEAMQLLFLIYAIFNDLKLLGRGRMHREPTYE